MKNTDLLLRVQSLKTELEGQFDGYKARDSNSFMKWKAQQMEKYLETVKIVEDKLIAAIRRDLDRKEKSDEVE